ncbi:MAG: biotin--[acetyl-CoA-carboxylase] ligase [Proteobacteria bacterium]|nr:biotin--[acetyl-CoA-carboxylase] ligase [Pseudomonadota bacterium]
MISNIRLPNAYTLIELETIGSTMDEAKRLADLGEAETPDGTIVWAKEQTAGRGRRGSSWISPRGNFYASLVLRPDVPLTQAAEIGFVAGLAIYDTIGELSDPGYDCRLKWPNDVLLNDRKLGGILMESKAGAKGNVDYVILGLGINLMHYPKDTDFPATSFTEEALVIPDVTFLESFARHFLDWMSRWVDNGFGPVRDHWKWRAKGLGAEIEVRLEGETLKGVFSDLDPSGALELTVDGKTRKISAGAVFFPSAKPT